MPGIRKYLPAYVPSHPLTSFPFLSSPLLFYLIRPNYINAHIQELQINASVVVIRQPINIINLRRWVQHASVCSAAHTILYLLTSLVSTAPNALADLKAKLKGFIKSKTSKKTEKPAEKPAEAAKPVEATPTNGAAPTETTPAVPAPAPAVARKYHHTTILLIRSEADIYLL